MIRYTKGSATPRDVQIGLNIREARNLALISQQELARRIGITFQQIQKYESGKNRVAASRLEHIARALDMPLMWFFSEGE
jgi:transcriptional regulator with XRE-family HTH domain